MKIIFPIVFMMVNFISVAAAQDSDYSHEHSDYSNEHSDYSEPEPARSYQKSQRKNPPFIKAEPREKNDHSLSLTISPFHLFLPIFELTMEIKLADKFGAAIICGGGSVTVNEGSSDETEVGLFEFGSQFKYYLSGNFTRGFHLGIEFMYVAAEAEVDQVSGTGTGFSLGLFGGYKHIFNNGITLEAQIGYQRYLIEAEASDGVNSAEDSSSDGGLLLNLTAGFSF